jgi:magnesium chelatase subunit ChlD-like protein
MSPSSRAGALPPVPVRPLDVGPLPSWLTPRRASLPSRRLSAVTRQRRQRGSGAIGAGSIDWLVTLRQRSIERRPRRLASPSFWVIALDCSASMLRSGALARAKGIALELTRGAGRASAQVRLVTFGGAGVHVAVGATRGQHRIDAAITSLGAGGATPLEHAVQRALDLCAARAREAPEATQHRIFLLTDGRIPQPLQPLAAPPPNTAIWVVDLELGPVRLGRAARIASALEASYVHADALRSTASA